MLTESTGAAACRSIPESFWKARATDPTIRAPDARERLANTLQRLADADLTASGYRVVLDTLARLLRTGNTSEAVPVQWMADRLHIHRNAVGAAYAAAESANLLRRIPVAERGAPTRTALAGPLLATLRLLATQPPERQDELRRLEPAPTKRHSLPAAPQQGPRPRIANQPVARKPGAHSPTPAQGREHTTVPLAPRATEATAAADPTLPLPPVRPAFDPTIQATLRSKVGQDVMYRVMTHPPGRPFAIDPAWGLSPAEADQLQLLVPTPERRPAQKAPPARPATACVNVPPAIARAALQALPKLTELVGERAAKVIDEIAYMVAEKGLGRGDVAGGFRAGLHLVGQGTWSTPRGFHPAWIGAALRAAQNGDAHNSVH
ncbi:hypothetical protein [Rhodanobacter sp. FW106-PBR-LB-2-11]|uniref:hypothetical protein n=1 Tax=Rhodanobacter sp. FW106-PBR-LB-2-11 TaxID=1524463 RepID=UPI0034E5F78C